MTEPSEAAVRLMHKLRTYGQFSEFAVPDRQAAIEIDRFAAERLAQRDERIRRLEGEAEFAARIANNLVQAHREGWQAAIEAPLTQEVVEAGIAAVGADDDRPAIELAIDVFNAMRRAIPYQPPEDRGDGTPEDRDA